MAAPQTRNRQEIQFTPNIPQTVALRYAQGKVVSGMSGDRVMFSTTDNRVMFVDLEVAQMIDAQQINVREEFQITLFWDGKKTSPRQWKVERTIGEQSNGTFVAPALPPIAPSAPAAAPKPPASATAAQPSGARSFETATSLLVAESSALIDAYAQVLRHALDTHQGRVKPDEVKSIFMTALINFSQGKRAA